MSIHKLVFLFGFLISIFSLKAQTSPSADASEIQLQINKLDVLGSVLYLAAHPDDENTRLIAYMAKQKLYRTGYLSITRGDGGQNLIGNEQGEMLGLIRTQELLAARRIDGGEQFFTRANDFGYTKNPEETFTFWNKDSILSDVVYVIRAFKPDVIICRFPTTGEGGHGQHTASAILATEAFSAAADPNRFPEQLNSVSTWQPKRLMWNTFSFGATNTTAPDQFKIDVGVFNPLLGRGYSEIAADSRSMHKSQGFGSGKNRGTQLEYFKTIAGEAPNTDIMDGVNTSWGRIAGGDALQHQVSKLSAEFKPGDPSVSIPLLIELYDAIQNLPDNYWKNQKKKEVEQLIILCSGLWFEAYSTQTTAVAGDTIDWKLQAITRSNVPIELKSVTLQQFDTTIGKVLSNNELFTFQRKQKLENNTPLSQPYWLKHPHSQGQYSVSSDSTIGEPENEPPVLATFHMMIASRDFFYSRPLVNKSIDPVSGEVYRPLSIAPPVTASIEAPVYIFSNAQPQGINILVKSSIDAAKGFISLKLPDGWNADPVSNIFELKNKGDEAMISFSVSPATNVITSGIDTIKAVIELEGKTFDRGLLEINYNHIPAITVYPVAQAKLVSVPLIIKGKKIGYIKGAGDFIPDMLTHLGYYVAIISDDDIADGNLTQYDAIITGIRAYNTKDRLRLLNQRLLDYVNRGGIMLVQYNTSDLVLNDIGPYPFKVSRGRVTDENAPVTFVNPDATILNTPNKITAQDFEGWIQERGLYFVSEVDSNYEKVLLMSDKEEAPLDGSLIVCNYGKGRFVYTGLSFFRQLPAGVPGAYRLFVNLISK
ncbi:MAG: PIG-L family deacetylase [Chitinophagales bacterium]|nr:PIG-L family deacetylase [Chitinophagales bacterium]